MPAIRLCALRGEPPLDSHQRIIMLSLTYAFPATAFEWKTKMEISAHTSLELATNVIGTLFKTKSTLSWVGLTRFQAPFCFSQAAQ
eukprot:1137959-Pelagomonas_calceolata.AAC.2